MESRRGGGAHARGLGVRRAAAAAAVWRAGAAASGEGGDYGALGGAVAAARGLWRPSVAPPRPPAAGAAEGALALEEAAAVLRAAAGAPGLGELSAARALSELALLRSLAAHAAAEPPPPLSAGNVSAGLGLAPWVRASAAQLRRLAEALPGDRLVIALGHLTLSALKFGALRPGPDGLARTIGSSTLGQAWWLGRQAAGATVRRICEVGFNAGHSAFAFLASAPAASLISFDLGAMSYTSACAQLVRLAFPRSGRFRLVVGPSNETLPEFVRERPREPRCDLIFVDGGHERAEAQSDLLWMSHLAERGRSLVVMDDVGCPSPECDGPTAVWEELRAGGRLRELGCEADSGHRWCWGTYV
ncbi:unnamed protein product [Prorocentrum cordatum]|uniref:Catechol O-methyltransferase n=1 Tax=Prorocentrum cordatum TaxID=2364126 RepID=A0ABN9T5P0_9DINO|nr:unnamed protein product [Polarella glacialis]